MSSEPIIISDKHLLYAALVASVIGLAMLWFISPAESEQRYVLKGTVVDVRGREALVNATMVVVGKGFREGDAIEQPVFWADNKFVSLSKSAK